DISLPDLAAAIRKAAQGEVVMHSHIAARVVQELEGGSHPDMASYAQLSEREREVLHLIAGGLSNADIAARLVLSEKTVKSHVRNILGKLHVADRTQAAVYAWRQGLMESSCSSRRWESTAGVAGKKTRSRLTTSALKRQRSSRAR